MAVITMTVTDGLTVIQARVSKAIAEVPGLLDKLVEQTGKETLTALKEATPVGMRTPHLAESYSLEVQSATATISTDQGLKYGWVTRGTEDKAPIRPRRARALYDAEFFPTPRAWVHGQAANPFQEEVFSNVQQYLEESLPPLETQLANTLTGG